MIKFKDKEYQLKTIFIMDEAKLAKQYKLLSSDDEVSKATGMIEICHILTGADVGDLNGSSLKQVSEFLRSIMNERAAAEPEVEKETSEDELGKTQAPPAGADS